ncbi:uncharacterized protein LOC119181078 [Rhipicephalus microplus]|uniref:uncharacterized protein LOC119181078 n=1 Tax=Rhipicephalus microplus TaxID=6941 RepID=UPI001888C13D|nr:LOW QUALITY PROTEIN: uncharacterized protein LOC119181078 [Rhipicephalus microplus]
MPRDRTCSVCDKPFTGDVVWIECSDCCQAFHAGKCAGISEATIKSKGQAYCDAWRCPTFRRARLRAASAESKEAGSEADMQDVRIWMKAINDKLDKLVLLKETVESIDDAVQYLSEKYDEILKKTEQNERDVKDIKRRLEKVEMRDQEVAEVQAEVDNLEWRSRRLNLEFHGIQETEDENLLEAINAMAIKHQFPPLAESDVVAIHRLPPRKDKTPVVICRFAKQADRDFWWKNRKKLSSLNEHFFLTENLTKRARALLFEAKNWAKEANFKYAWHSNRKVLVRKADGEKAIRIANASDLNKLS